jgi:hypothetical protein
MAAPTHYAINARWALQGGREPGALEKPQRDNTLHGDCEPEVDAVPRWRVGNGGPIDSDDRM